MAKYRKCMQKAAHENEEAHENQPSGKIRLTPYPPFLRLLMIILAGNAAMQGQTVQGVINGRSGATMTLQTVDTPKLVVLLTPTTEVDEVQGVLKARKKQMAVTSLIPGLPVQVQGTTNDQGQLVADSVKFKGNDLKAAMDAQAGLQPTVAAQQADQQKIAAERAGFGGAASSPGGTTGAAQRCRPEDCR